MIAHPVSQPAGRRLLLTVMILGLAALLFGATLLVLEHQAGASSHREAPLISKDPYADNTDTYVWIPKGHTDRVVLAALYIPFESPEGGPNYFEWDDNVYYDIHVDNNGDAVPDITYTLQSQTEVANPNTFLYNTGPITSLDDPDWNRHQYITVWEKIGAGAPVKIVDHKLTTPVNIGSKSTPDFPDLTAHATYSWTDPNNSDVVKAFAGQRDDPFWVDLQVFDLLTLRGQNPPIGYTKGNNIPIDSLAGYNAHAFVIEAPISRLKNTDPVLGVWATARRASLSVLAADAPAVDPVQVSRLGMPLVNEAVLPIALKDAFNSIVPHTDLDLYTGAGGPAIQALLQKSVEDPELGTLLCGLYGVPLPADGNADCHTPVTVGTPRSGRGDIFDIFLTGMVLAKPFTIHTANGDVQLPAGFNVNRPAGARPAEMIRISTAISGTLCAPTPQRLGVLAGDACGFPNGRRPTDDVIDIELLAVAGAAYQALDGRDATFSFNPALASVLDDGLNGNDTTFFDHFPYLYTPHSGQERLHQNPFAPVYMPFVAKSHNVAQSLQDTVAQHPAGGMLMAFGVGLLLGAPILWRLRRRMEAPMLDSHPHDED